MDKSKIKVGEIKKGEKDLEIFLKNYGVDIDDIEAVVINRNIGMVYIETSKTVG